MTSARSNNRVKRQGNDRLMLRGRRVSKQGLHTSRRHDLRYEVPAPPKDKRALVMLDVCASVVCVFLPRPGGSLLQGKGFARLCAWFLCGCLFRLGLNVVQ